MQEGHHSACFVEIGLGGPSPASVGRHQTASKPTPKASGRGAGASAAAGGWVIAFAFMLCSHVPMERIDLALASDRIADALDHMPTHIRRQLAAGDVMRQAQASACLVGIISARLRAPDAYHDEQPLLPL